MKKVFHDCAHRNYTCSLRKEDLLFVDERYALCMKNTYGLYLKCKVFTATIRVVSCDDLCAKLLKCSELMMQSAENGGV